MESLRAASEWLEADGLGGYASGTAGMTRTRRYHALLLCATTPPTGRVVLVNGFDAWVETAGGRYAITSQRYAPDVEHPDGAARAVDFTCEPWPRWTFRLDDGTEVIEELLVPRGASVTALAFRLARPGAATLTLRPFLSGREDHALHHENPAFRFDPEYRHDGVVVRPYPGVPGILFRTSGDYRHQPDWYRHFLYSEERARGLDHVEDLAAPGWFTFDLGRGEAALVLAAVDASGAPIAGALEGPSAIESLTAIRDGERVRREAFASPLRRAADSYIVARGAGRSIIAGYPWFTDWGRDTFIAMRGLCLATGRLDEARRILVEWAGALSEGMVPNRFPDRGQSPEYNSVDASLWYVIAAGDLRRALSAARLSLPESDAAVLREAVDSILGGYAAGTRHGIRRDEDGLLAAGAPGVQLTWMDARVGERVVTPRIGKPVELQALWVNALDVGAAFSTACGPRWARLRDQAKAQFGRRFWDPARGWLADVIDADHRPGAVDDSFRPNQVLAIGGLPLPLLDPLGDVARRVVDAVEERLLTPMGLRSLAPGSPGYAPHYRGSAAERDGAYHQGTVWPWLMGPFVDAWARVRGDTHEARHQAHDRFIAPLLARLPSWNGHVPEVADAEPPHAPGGCPFQAWSLSELIRVTDGDGDNIPVTARY